MKPTPTPAREPAALSGSESANHATVRRGVKGRLTRKTTGVVAALLVLPVCALLNMTRWLDWRLLATLPFAISLFAFLVYRSDKRRAESGNWRISESTLHLADLMGGWPGGLLAQRMFRHKTAKKSFQFVFWSTVLLHQFLSADSLLGWKYTTHALQVIRAKIHE